MNTALLEAGRREHQRILGRLKGQAWRPQDVPPSRHVDMFRQSEKILELWRRVCTDVALCRHDFFNH